MSQDLGGAGRIAIIRHGQTTWSESGRHTSATDIDLTPEGVRQAGIVPGVLAGLGITAATVLVSPRLRARRTAELAGLTGAGVVDDLAEWNYGAYEGLTTGQIREQRPDWTIFADGAPGGESPQQVSDRADRVLRLARGSLAAGDVVLVCHGHFGRALTARWAGFPVSAGAALALDPAAVTVLGDDRGVPTIEHSNVVPLITAATR